MELQTFGERCHPINLKNHRNVATHKEVDTYNNSLGLIVNEGKIIDASFVISPRQHNTLEEQNLLIATILRVKNFGLTQELKYSKKFY